MKVYILRGIPGSGKSTWAQKREEEFSEITEICSADEFFVENGEYRFNPALLPLAHGACLRQFVNCLLSQHSKVEHLIVDNCNTHLWELAPYLQLAKAYDVEVEFIRFVAPLQVCIERGKHKVPATTVERLLRGYEILPKQLGMEVTVYTDEVE